MPRAAGYAMAYVESLVPGVCRGAALGVRGGCRPRGRRMWRGYGTGMGTCRLSLPPSPAGPQGRSLKFPEKERPPSSARPAPAAAVRSLPPRAGATSRTRDGDFAAQRCAIFSCGTVRILTGAESTIAVAARPPSCPLSWPFGRYLVHKQSSILILYLYLCRIRAE